MSLPLVSIVMPAYNSGQFIYEAIESVLKQSYQNLQVIILDDGSSDNTVTIVKQFSDQRIEFHGSQVNHGQALQLNMGIERAKGEYICIMHSDDVMHEHKIEKQLRFFNNNPTVDICGTNVNLIGDGSGTWTYPRTNQECKDLLLSAAPFAHPAVMFKAKLKANKDFTYDQQMVPAEDYDLWVRMAKVASLGNVQEVLLNYRIHPQQIGKIENKREEELLFKIRQKMFRELLDVQEADLTDCVNAIYYPERSSIGDTVKSAVLLWKKNQHIKFFSPGVLRGRLKHVLYKSLSCTNVTNRIRIIFSSNDLIGIAGIGTMLRILFANRKKAVNG